MSLFEDNDASDHENNDELVSDFKLKLRFAGEKGKKVKFIFIFYTFIDYEYLFIK